MQEEEKEAEAQTEAEKEAVKESSKNFVRVLLRYFRRSSDIKTGVDEEATISGIVRDIEFRGPNLWILALSILIASIGLNTNSTAIIIGAMLISPLMGPILGVGLSVGINDFALLKKSGRNLLNAVAISLLASSLYFFISPLDTAQSELLARTHPTLLDVLIATFGGFAGAIAGSRKDKSNVVPGVAIATALIPPALYCWIWLGYRSVGFPFRGFVPLLHQRSFHRPVYLNHGALFRFSQEDLHGPCKRA